jgi:hypothetical protein
MLAYLAQAARADDKAHKSFAYSCLDVRPIGDLVKMAECELVSSPRQLDTHPCSIEAEVKGAVAKLLGNGKERAEARSHA